MSRGVLIHAVNNEQIDYTLIAQCNALMIKSHLKVPVALITNQASDHLTAFDQIIIQKNDHSVGDRRFFDTPSVGHLLPWYNTTRADSYRLSPFDETLLIDADYLVMDGTLNGVWGSPHEVMLNRRIIPLNHGEVPVQERWLGTTRIPLCWATCVYFRKSPFAEMMFDLIQHIRSNYKSYSMIYGFPARSYRNDYAFSIAVHMLGGVASLPSPFLFTSFDCDELIDVPAKDELTLLLNDRANCWRFLATRTKRISVHVLNKFSIIRQADKLIDLYSEKPNVENYEL